MSGRRRAHRRRRTWPGVALVAALVAVAAVVVVLHQRSAFTTSPAGRPAPQPSRLSNVDVSALPIARQPFCTRLRASDVTAVLGSPFVAHEYGPGDRVRLAPGLTDVAHEYGCTYAAASGSEARVWIFAAPVRTARARGLTRQARAEPGCQELNGPSFGTPSVTTACSPASTHGPASVQVTLRGLFGQTWMSCQLTTAGSPTTDVARRRAERWCLSVATTLGARS